MQSSPLPRLTLHSNAPECSGCMVRTGSSSTPLLALWLSSSNLSRINKVICQQHPVQMMLAVVLVLTLNTSWALCTWCKLLQQRYPLIAGWLGCIEAKCSLSASLSHCEHFWALSAAHCAQASSIECNFVCSLN